MSIKYIPERSGVINNAAARSASPFEGQVIFQKDTDQLLVYNGTAWVVPNSPAQNPTGLELVKTQTIGNAVTVVTVNDAFSATYKSYLIQFTDVNSSAAGVVTFALNGLTSGYFGNLIFRSFAGGTPTSSGYNNTASVTHAGGTTGTTAVLNLVCINPFLSKQTFIFSDFIDTSNAGRTTAFQSSSTSATGFNMSTTAGTITGGQVTVYGYRNG